MAHFANIDADSVVTNVIVISNSDAPDPAPTLSEELGIEFITTPVPNGLGLEGNWVQTSYHGAFRKQFAGSGFTYDPTADVFIAPQPYPSWTLDANHDWQPPIPYPTDGGMYVWDETTLSWVEIPASQPVME